MWADPNEEPGAYQANAASYVASCLFALIATISASDSVNVKVVLGVRSATVAEMSCREFADDVLIV